MKNRDNFGRMTSTPVPRLILGLAVPTIISMLVTALYNVADTYFVGRIDTRNVRHTGDRVFLRTRLGKLHLKDARGERDRKCRNDGIDRPVFVIRDRAPDSNRRHRLHHPALLRARFHAHHTSVRKRLSRNSADRHDFHDGLAHAEQPDTFQGECPVCDVRHHLGSGIECDTRPDSDFRLRNGSERGGDSNRDKPDYRILHTACNRPPHRDFLGVVQGFQAYGKAVCCMSRL